MKALIISIISVYAIAISIFGHTHDTASHPRFVKENNVKWELANIYDISIIDGVYYFNGKKLLPNIGIEEAINKIMTDDTTAYPSIIQIEVKYIEDEDLYIANLVDEYIVE